MTNPTERVNRAVDDLADEHGCVNAADALAADREHGDLRDGDTWGRWTWREDLNVLRTEVGAFPYDVDLDRCETDAEAWDWVQHVAAKGWATDRDVGALVRALRATVGRVPGGGTP